MIKHFIRLLWNKKNKNSLMIIEIFLSFIVLFAILSIALTNLINFNSDIGYNAENLWILRMERNSKHQEDAGERILNLKTELNQINGVRGSSVVNWGMIFLGGSTNSSTNVYYEGKNYLPHPFYADDDYAKLMELNISEGRWFSKEDNAASIEPIIINHKFRQDLFGNEPAIGKVIGLEKYKNRVVGVVKIYKGHGEFSKTEPVVFNRVVLSGKMYHSSVFLRVSSAADAQLEKDILEKVSALEKDWTFHIETSDELISRYYTRTFIPLLVLGIVACFLILNVILGLFGALWYSINQRKAEIGLRRAKGAVAKQIYQQFIIEMFILASFSTILGSFLAIQFPILNIFPDVDLQIYLIAILASILIIYLLIFLCALYPSRQAMQIQPAMALHDE